MSILLPERVPTILTETTRRAINHIAFSRDGSRIALGHVGMSVEVREGVNVLYRAEFFSRNEKVRPTQRIRGVAFSPEGRVLYVAAGEKVHAVDLEGGQRLWSYVAPRSFGFLIISPISLSVSKEGDVAIAFDNGTFGLWSPDGRRGPVWRENESPRFLQVLPGGDRIVGSDTFSLCVWDIHSKKRLTKIALPERVYALSAAANGTDVATRGLQATQVWNLEQSRQIGSAFNGLGLPVVQLHPTERVMALGDGNGISVVETTGRFLERYETGEAAVLCAAFSPDGSRLLAGAADGRLWSWDFGRG